MLDVNDPDELHLAARLLEYFDVNAPWQRRLWEVGTVLSLRELAEASEAVAHGTLSASSLGWLRQQVAVAAGRDPGVGAEDGPRRQLQQLLTAKDDLRPTGAAFIRLRHLTESATPGYLARWADILGDRARRPKPERAARYIAGHLLDLGYSSGFLLGWWRWRFTKESGLRTIADLVSAADELAQRQLERFEVLFSFSHGETGVLRNAPNWRTSRQVVEWLHENNSSTENLRPSGGWLVEVTARDRAAAAYAAQEFVERILVRAEIGSRNGAPRLSGKAWVRGKPAPVELSRSRALNIHALDRQGRISVEGTQISAVDDAIELAAHLDFAAPGPAVATGWAAIEALLAAPGDAERVMAGDRLATLVACSFVRAELTSLAHHYEGQDELATAIKNAPTNRDRARLMAEAINGTDAIAFSFPSDFAAVGRMRSVLSDPARAMRDVQEHATKAFRRLYRLRNLVLHQGKTDAVALGAALRTAAPLVGAGFDRVTHAWYANGVKPLELATVAQLRLELVRANDIKGLVSLLD